MNTTSSMSFDPDKAEAIWTGSWPTATGEAIQGRVNFAAYELLLWTRLVRAGR